MNANGKDIYKTSRFLYILEAMLEYVISIFLGGAYIAKVTTSLGISDGVTGVIYAFGGLASTFQLIAIFIAHKKPVKRWVTICHTINQLFFACVYLVPFFNFSKTTKIILFISFLLLGNIINQVINAPKTNWFMSLIDDSKRGSFIAIKEFISLIGGMIFSFIIGMVMDYYEAIGNNRAAFLFCSIGIIVLTVMHTGTLLFSKEKPAEKVGKTSIKKEFGEIVKNKGLWRIILCSILWRVASSISQSFYGTYQVKELAFSLTFVSVLSLLGVVFRAIVLRPIGKLADKSFVNTLKVCYLFGGLMFVVMMFTVPQNGKIFFIIYTLFQAIAGTGIDNCEMNLVYNIVKEELRTSALALRMAVSGIVGFVTTLAVSPLVTYIQNNGNQFFGLNVYAQQVVSALSALGVIILLLFLHKNEKKINVKNKLEELGE